MSLQAILLSSLDTSKLESLLQEAASSSGEAFSLPARLIQKERSSYRGLSVLRDYIWEKLNTGHWKDVSPTWRNLYASTIVYQILSVLKVPSFVETDVEVLQDLIRLCDMGLLMGAPICNDICSTWANDIHMFISGFNPSSKRPKHSSPSKPPLKKILNPSIDKIPTFHQLDLGTFVEKYKTLGQPVIIKGLVDDWPGREKWSVPYLRSLAGYRTVPIEIGSRYTDGNWTQRLMTLNDFIDGYIERKDEIGYLAQHNLLDQVPSLKEDIVVPEFCFSGEEPLDVNFWFGPPGTVSPLHTDPKHNILAQVVGFKYVRLYDPSQTKYLYPYSEEDLMSNTSQVDVEDPDIKKFPDFSRAVGFEGILEPGDGLYIPPKMWHYVKSLSLSFSVSFWF